MRVNLVLVDSWLSSAFYFSKITMGHTALSFVAHSYFPKIIQVEDILGTFFTYAGSVGLCQSMQIKHGAYMSCGGTPVNMRRSIPSAEEDQSPARRQSCL
jgi:hypothetical protein